MALRLGMYDIIDRWRASVNDADSSCYAFTDERVQSILDNRRSDFFKEPLVVTSQQIALGTVEYHVYMSRNRNLEGTASGSVAFRLYDSSGTAIASGFTFDAINGRFDFTANQAGSARYFDGRAYDLNGAIADGWRERAGMQASGYDFRVEGRQYSRSQWFDHCMTMAESYDSKSTGSTKWGSDTVGNIERGDWC